MSASCDSKVQTIGSDTVARSFHLLSKSTSHSSQNQILRRTKFDSTGLIFQGLCYVFDCNEHRRECFGFSYDFAHSQLEFRDEEKEIFATSRETGKRYLFLSTKSWWDCLPLIRMAWHILLRYMLRWRLRDVDLRRMHSVMRMNHFLV